jgi:hypothetical protein
MCAILRCNDFPGRTIKVCGLESFPAGARTGLTLGWNAAAAKAAKKNS